MQSKQILSIGLVAATLALGALAATPAQAQFQVRFASGVGSIPDINAAEAAIVNPGATLTAFSPFAVINFGPGGIGGGSPFPGGLSDNFALESLGRLTFNTAGAYVFRVISDDGFRLRTGVDANGAGGVTYSEFTTQRASGTTDGGVVNALAGNFLDTRLTYFEAAGGEDVELSYSRDGGVFQLVGSTADITVSNIGPVTVPESGTVGLMISGFASILGGVLVRRRIAKK